MLPATAKRLYAAISVDTSLPKKRRRDREDVRQEVAMNDMEENVDRLNPASNLQTVCVKTYQNYKSALKWWCDLEEHAVLLYVLFCLTYVYCTLYTVRTIHCTDCVHSLFPRADIFALRHHTLVQLYKFT